MSQKTFALDRDANFRNLQDAMSRFRVWAPEWAYAQRRGLARRIESLIKQIEFCSGRGPCTSRVEVLSFRCGMSDKTTRRTIADAEELGLVEVVRGAERDERTGGYGPNRYRICWERIERLAVAKCPVGHDDQAPGHHDRAPGHDDQAFNKEVDQLKVSPNSTSPDVVSKAGKAWPETITQAELGDTQNVERLYRIAVRVFKVPDTDRDRRGFHSAARQARTAPVASHGALFTSLVKERAWNLWPGTPKAITERADTEAGKQIKLLDRGPPKPRVSNLEARPGSADEQIRKLMGSKYATERCPNAAQPLGMFATLGASR